ncbi:TPA: FAD-binding oxidoreductase [Legionella pneumophila]|nr:FAD-binding protein [Legionella pneumophila]HAU1575365.1 FAD-binding oxidoreductase [Legionella pneumophila]HAU1681682.1 FAD-binding oxidoreductase [Legionella pneumophila]HAU3699051.1 FAD-binding oxidoreductase [Legionella pneumophila]
MQTGRGLAMKLWIMLFNCFIATFLITFSHAKAPVNNNKSSYCLPNQPCWPTSKEWEHLNKKINGHLIKARNYLSPCIEDPQSDGCKNTLEEIKNPFYLETQPTATQSTGWFEAWDSEISPYIVAAKTAQEIAHAVKFARKHHIKLVVKGTGHDYLGRSNAPDSLLIWTHHMREIQFQKHFVPNGCPANYKGVPAVTAEAGTRWIEAYKEVTVNRGRYVQGGGCTSVGVAGGFIQGGGFGSFSKKYGTGAGGILEAEVIIADGSILIANECQNQDLYWALKGGGGGTYGIVSKITLETHELPATFGALTGSITAKTEQDFKNLIDYFIIFYRERLHNEHWGEQVILDPDNKMTLALVFQGMSKTQVDRLWQPFKIWLSQKPEHYQFTINSLVLPARKFWDYDYLSKNLPDHIVIDKRKNVPYPEFWWAGNQSEVSIYLTHYQSGYLPYTLFQEKFSNKLSNALFEASRLTKLSLHFNKGLAGASQQAIERQRKTSMNPSVLDAAALITIIGGQHYVFPKLPGHKPDLDKARFSAKQAKKAMKLISALNPDSGTYGNEADYNLKNWQRALWGSNYEKLLQIKHHYDPKNLFNCHHCVGSE